MPQTTIDATPTTRRTPLRSTLRTSVWGAAALAVLLTTGCAATAATPTVSGAAEAVDSAPETPADGGHAGHGGAGAEPAAAVDGPSEAAMMVCEGQVREAVTGIFALGTPATGTWAWEEPVFTCTYDVDGAPLTLTVFDTDDLAVGEQHFADLKAGLADVSEIEGMAGLGMPSFSTPAGIVGFLRDGKTLTVDATALPDGLGAGGTRTPEQAAYTLASAVLACWTAHD